MTVGTDAFKARTTGAGVDAELARLLGAARGFSVEFPQFLASHLPMVLIALRHMGASDARLAEFFAIYRDANGLVEPPPPVAPIERAHWTDALGRRDRETDYRSFFMGEVARLGPAGAMATYLRTLVPGIGASATHALMRLAYGAMAGEPDEIAVALGYWATTFLPLPQATGAPPVTDDPSEVLLRMRPVPAYRHVETELDLLWHSMKAVAAKAEFRPVVDWLRIGPDSLGRVAAASLALYAGTMDFCALHAVTGSHWVRIVQPFAPDPDLVLRYFWQVIAALYPKIGLVDLPAAETLAEWRRLPCPDWPDIEAKSVLSNDEHDISLVFSASEEWKLRGDRLYQVVAARRVGLIP